MDFEELMAKLKEMENGEEMVQVILDRLHTVNKEAKNLRNRMKTAETELQNLKNTKNPLIEVLENIGFKYSEDDPDIIKSVTDFITTLKNSEEIEKHPTVIKLLKQVDSLSKLAETEAKEKEQLKIEQKKSTIKNSLLKRFSEDILNGEKILNLIVDSANSPFTITEDNQVAFKLADGDIITGTDSILEQYKKLHPNEVTNKSKPGANTQQNCSPMQIPKIFNSLEQIRALTAQQIRNLTPEQKAQMMGVLKNSAVA